MSSCVRIVTSACCFWFGAWARKLSSANRHRKMASPDPPRLIGHIIDFLRGTPESSEIWACVANTVNDPLFPNFQDINADLSHARNYLVLLAGALEFSVFPHGRPAPRAESLGIDTRISARFWATSQIKENLNDNSWMHANSLGAVTDISNRASPEWATVAFRRIFRRPWLESCSRFGIRLARVARSAIIGLCPPLAWTCLTLTPLFPFMGSG